MPPPEKDAFTLVTSSNNIFQKITSGFLLPRLEGDTFLELVYNKAHNSCNYLLRNRHMKEDNLDRRSLQILFDHGGYDVSQGNRSGHIHQQRTQEQGLSDNSIKKDKMNARVYCHVGAYLAMCKLFAENVIDEERKVLLTLVFV
uniref:Alpha/beta-Hydrolases superfamily protein n=1 Tax=Meloidogyne hapla TaxID=6305 RepID=A0A1I8BC60_MELHA